MRNKLLLRAGLTFSLFASVILFLACQKSGNSSSTNTATGTGTLTVNSTSYSKVVCKQAQDTASKNPLAVVPAVTLVAINGTDSVEFFIINPPTQSSWTGGFTNGDSSAVKIGNNNSVTYTGYILGGFIHINGSNIVDFSVTSAGGTLTKTGANSFTFSCTTHTPGTTATDLTISGSGSF